MARDDSYQQLRHHLDHPPPRVVFSVTRRPHVVTPSPIGWEAPLLATVEPLIARLGLRQRVIVAATAGQLVAPLWEAFEVVEWGASLTLALGGVERWLNGQAIREELIAMDRGVSQIRRQAAPLAGIARTAGDDDRAAQLDAAIMAALTANMVVATAINVCTVESQSPSPSPDLSLPLPLPMPLPMSLPVSNGSTSASASASVETAIVADPAVASVETATLAVQSAARAGHPHPPAGEFLTDWWSVCRHRLAFVDAGTGEIR